MIKSTINKDGSLYVEEWCEPPTVYLDHWAWRKISESEALTKRFSDALKSRHGTLAFSWLNVIEFSKVTVEEQCRKAYALLETVWPNVFVLYPNFFKVIEQEDKILAGGERVAPHADLETLKGILKLSSLRSDSLHPLPPPNLFSLVRSTGITFDPLADLIIDHIESLRKDYRENHNFRLMVNRIPKGGSIEFGTKFIARELLSSFLKNKTLQIDRNHAMDLSHAIVAVTYCDYVLLDGHWATQVEQARKKLKSSNFSFPIAKVFSEKRNGIENFLQALESDDNFHESH